MEKRAVLFLIISLLIVIAYPYLLEILGVYEKEPRQPTDQELPQKTKDSKRPIIPVVPAPDSAPAQERMLTIETQLYKATLNTRGGTITQWELKTYREDRSSTAEQIQLFSTSPEKEGPLSIITGDEAYDKELQEGVYHVEGEDLRLNAKHPTGTISLILDDPAQNLYVAKHLTFYHDNYQVDMELDTQGIPELYQLSVGTNFGIADWAEQGFVGHIGPVSMQGETLHKDKPPKMENTVRYEGAPTWAALQDKYFIAALIPKQASATVVRKTHDQAVTTGVEFSSGTRQSVRLYAGPKEFDRLAALQVGLEKSIDFGWFMFGSWWLVRAVAEPLFHILRFFYQYTHNYGLAIILLTIGVKVLFVPLMHKSHKSMKAMQVLQPKVAALQKKLKDDRERLNRELMDMYKKYGANPLGGCLPILLQMPVFIALFDVLYTAIELRQAPFILWIADLSTKDPYYVLPIIMGASMVIQQKMQPTTMDPRQAKIFMFMPVFFTFLFLNFPAGLVLYWLTNNVLTIIQQYITMKYIEKPV
jgi:YidC/Oxa1 family membrane protein insertase